MKYIKDLYNKSILRLVDIKSNIFENYLKEADDQLDIMDLMFERKYIKQAVVNAYYSMYNALLALLFRYGIKSENHNASIFLLKHLFLKDNLFSIIENSKKERINKQYYPNSEIVIGNVKILMEDAREFVLRIKEIIDKTSKEDIDVVLKRFKELLK